jgi:hypothetical protein
MKLRRSAAALAVLVAAGASTAGALSAQTADQVVSYEVAAIDEISVAGTPSLIVNAGTAGSQPGSASASGTYSVTTNGTGMKITAEIDAAMPAGVTLTASLAAPAGATSAGVVTLSPTPQDAVSGITEVAESGLGITYGLEATVSAGVVSGNRTVTYTITSGS